MENNLRVLQGKVNDVKGSGRKAGSAETSVLRTVLSSHSKKRKALDSDTIVTSIKRTRIMTRLMLKDWRETSKKEAKMNKGATKK